MAYLGGADVFWWCFLHVHVHEFGNKLTTTVYSKEPGVKSVQAVMSHPIQVAL